MKLSGRKRRSMLYETDYGYEEESYEEWYDGWYDHNEDRTEDVWEGVYD